MLKFKFITNIILILVLGIGVLISFYGTSFWWYILPLALLVFFITLGSFRIGMSFYFDVVCDINTENGIVITFDDGPDEKVTPKVLEVLKKNNVKAVFFFIGHKAEKYPDLVQQVFNDGHIIGNHSYCHKNTYGFYSSAKIIADIERTAETIRKIIGVKPKFFRPPFGVTNPSMKSALQKLKILPVGWSLRSLDTVKKDRAKLKNRLAAVKAGDIVLFHDRVEGIDIIVEDFIIYCRQQQLEFVSLEEALNINAYE